MANQRSKTMDSANPWKRNLVLLNAISFARTFMIIMPIFVPLMQSYGLTMQETMLLQSIFAAVTLVLEVPSGYMADVLGRKTTLMLGYLMAGVGFSQVIWANTFLELAIFEMTLGVAMSLVSGSDTALAFESEKAMNHDQAQPAIARLLSWMNFGEGVAALCAFVIVRYDMLLVLWVQAIVGWVPFALGMFLVEPPKLESKAVKKSTQAAFEVIKATPVILFFPGVFIATMSSTYLVAWLNQNLWQAHRLPLEYFGLAWGLYSVTVGLAARFSVRLPDRIGHIGQFSMMAVLLFLGFIAISSRQLWLIIVGGLMISAFRGLVAPKIKILINNAIANDYRATVNSLVAACFRVVTLV
jgi:MFS family permease